MIQFVCAIKDSASGLFGRPIFVVKPAQAMRSFTDEVNRAAPDNELHRHPEDFELYCLGSFDDSTGHLSPLDSGPSLIVRGKDAAQGANK